MEIFQIIIALLLGGVVLTAIARRASLPYPALLAIAGAALSLLPNIPTLVFDPTLALALFVAPVLLDAAFDTSQRDLRRNWRAVTSLALGAVVLTVIAVAVTAHAFVPDLPWWAAIALGAIVAPPDAAAATAVLKQLRPPHRLLVILEGESLFNDASALLIYRFAVGATITGVFSGTAFAGTLAVVFIGSIVLAFVLSKLVGFVTGRISDVPTAIVFQFCGTFAVWMLAELLHLSAILTMVLFAMFLSRAASMVGARIRVPSYAVWEVTVFVLNVLAFILVGLQLRQIVERTAWTRYIGVAAGVSVVVVATRLVWVSGAAFLSRWRCRDRGAGADRTEDVVALSGREAAVVGWCGMRGIVTLAAALALPLDFPHRDLIFFTSFTVVLVTLVVHGLTLRPLIQWLDVRDDGTVDREVHLARVESLRAALDAVQRCEGENADLLRQRYELRLRRSEGDVHDAEHDLNDIRAIRVAVTAERQRLIELRDSGTIGDAAFQVIEQELDRKELDLLEFARV
ncbi:MAG: monovalent cation/hydrogen antiporter [Acidobacteriota bacterium]|jgi:CPA1 family monovalent cation:H+ antiporter|nr:monovalent cation/hydrogen antiporter [Acidobacteriota bacterium]